MIKKFHIFLLMIFISSLSFSNPLTSNAFPYKHPSLVTQAAVLAGLSLLPFMVMLLTSFAKISIVLALLRNALGTQQAPPNQVINGISLILTIFVMYPTGMEMWERAQPVLEKHTNNQEKETAEVILDITQAIKEPLRDFLKKNSYHSNRLSFLNMSFKSFPKKVHKYLNEDDFLILIPSFVMSQLKSAFEVGILIYLPFFIIDLVTSNILLAMGMMMLSPITISLPLKIFLLVMLDGWTMLVSGLLSTYN